MRGVNNDLFEWQHRQCNALRLRCANSNPWRRGWYILASHMRSRSENHTYYNRLTLKLLDRPDGKYTGITLTSRLEILLTKGKVFGSTNPDVNIFFLPMMNNLNVSIPVGIQVKFMAQPEVVTGEVIVGQDSLVTVQIGEESYPAIEQKPWESSWPFIADNLYLVENTKYWIAYVPPFSRRS